MPDHYAVFIGDVALDEFFRPSQWPATGTKIDLFPVSTETGGMIANAAAVYAGFGENARFLWAMNDTSLTDALLADLTDQGVDTSLVVRQPGLADSRNIIVLTDGEHTVLTPALGLETHRPVRRSNGHPAGGAVRVHRDRGPALAATCGPVRRAGHRHPPRRRSPAGPGPRRREPAPGR